MYSVVKAVGSSQNPEVLLSLLAAFVSFVFSYILLSMPENVMDFELKDGIYRIFQEF